MKSFVVLIMVAFMGGCMATTPGDVDPDAQFGHRVDGTTDDGRTTITINPPDASVSYRYFPATFESVIVRPAPASAAGDSPGVPVEVLIKGSFPDACAELHDVSQVRRGRMVEVTLQMRRATGSVCAAVLRPYRFYLQLEGAYEPGAYTMTLNGKAHSFEIAVRPVN